MSELGVPMPSAGFKDFMPPTADPDQVPVLSGDVLRTIFQMCQHLPGGNSHVRLVCRDWRSTFDGCIQHLTVHHQRRCTDSSDGRGGSVLGARNLPQVASLDLTDCTVHDADGADFDALLHDAARLPRLTTLHMGFLPMLRRSTAPLPPSPSRPASLDGLPADIPVAAVQAAELVPDAAVLAAGGLLPAAQALGLAGPADQLLGYLAPTTSMVHATAAEQVLRLPASISCLSNLTHLTIKPGCALELLPVALQSEGALGPELCGLTSLEQLQVTGLQLPRQHLAQLARLSSLSLCCSGPVLARSVMYLSRLASLSSLSLAFLPERAVGVPTQVVDMLPINCCMFSGLQRLAESGVRLRELAYTGAFLTLPMPQMRNWTSLEALDLSHNTLVSDQAREQDMLSLQLGPLTGLTRLVLASNLLGALPDSVCNNLTKLRHLDMSSNKMCELPEGLTNLAGLTHLDASGNALTQLPGELTLLSSLTHLNIAGNRLARLPLGLAQLPGLKALLLGRNRLTYLPPPHYTSSAKAAAHGSSGLGLGLAPGLTLLDFSSNHMDHLPASLSQLRDLQVLHCGQNYFKLCNVQLPCLRNLRELDIRHMAAYMRDADTFLQQVGALRGLTCLQAASNAMTALPASWACLTGMRRLMLAHNRLSELPDRLLASLSLLEVLDLSSNRLAFVPDAITALTCLTSLDISVNTLQALPDGLGLSLPRLRSLDLHYNLLTHLPPSVSGLVCLRELNVARNYSLKHLPADLAELPCLGQLSVSRGIMAGVGVDGSGEGEVVSRLLARGIQLHVVA